MVERNSYTIKLVPERLLTPELVAMAEKDDGANWDEKIRNLMNRPVPLVKSGTQIVLENSVRKKKEP